MAEFIRSFNNGIYGFLGQLKSMSVVDYIDIAIVAVLLYQLYKFIRGRRAGKLAAGVMLLVLIFIISEFAGMNALGFLLSNIFQVGIISVIILFQPEIRSALEKVGAEPFRGLRNITDQKSNADIAVAIKHLCDAVCDMAKTKTGALLVIERTTKLGDIIKTGTVINANITSLLVKNVFFNKAPLHDGAAIIVGTRLYAAGCFLPLSEKEDIIADLGTRHRAAIGMSENSDAIVIVVSEETGTISMALNGELRRNLDYNSLSNQLSSLLLSNTKKAKDEKKVSKSIFKFIGRKDEDDGN